MAPERLQEARAAALVAGMRLEDLDQAAHDGGEEVAPVCVTDETQGRRAHKGPVVAW